MFAISVTYDSYILELVRQHCCHRVTNFRVVKMKVAPLWWVHWVIWQRLAPRRLHHIVRWCLWCLDLHRACSWDSHRARCSLSPGRCRGIVFELCSSSGTRLFWSGLCRMYNNLLMAKDPIVVDELQWCQRPHQRYAWSRTCRRSLAKSLAFQCWSWPGVCSTSCVPSTCQLPSLLYNSGWCLVGRGFRQSWRPGIAFWGLDLGPILGLVWVPIFRCRSLVMIFNQWSAQRSYSTVCSKPRTSTKEGTEI